LAPYFKAFIQERVERLVLEGEKLPEFLQGKEELAPMRKQAAEAMDADEVDCLINAARGMDIPIFEYIYQTGIMDGIKMSGLIEQMKKG
jgi:hypothetical protein